MGAATHQQEVPLPRITKNTPTPRNSESNNTTILLTGDATRRRRIKHALRDLRPPIRSVAWSDKLVDELEGPIAAFVLAAPIVDVPLPIATKTIRKRRELASVPIFAVVDSGLADDAAAALYARGITAVVGWPHESRVFPRILVESVAANQVRGAATTTDKALERLVRTHLKDLPSNASRVSVAVRNGIVYLSGSIRTLWDKRQGVEAIGNVMAVRSVIADALIVTRSTKTDRQLLHGIRNVLKATHGVDFTTLAPSVRNGYVTLSGTAESKRELEKIEDVLVHVDGVRGIEKLATISRRNNANNRTVAKRLEQRLAHTHPQDDVEACYFGGVAVLSGRARSLRERRAIVSAVEADEAVKRVVDKIDI